MLNLRLLGLDEIHSGKIAVEWDLIHGDNEMSWRILCSDGNSLTKERKRLLTAYIQVWRDVTLGLIIAGEKVNSWDFCVSY